MAGDLDYRIAIVGGEAGRYARLQVRRIFDGRTTSKSPKMFKAKLPDVKVIIIERGCDLAVLSFDEIQRRAKLADAA